MELPPPTVRGTLKLLGFWLLRLLLFLIMGVASLLLYSAAHGIMPWEWFFKLRQ